MRWQETDQAWNARFLSVYSCYVLLRVFSPLAGDLIVLDKPFWFNVDSASSRPSFLRATLRERKSKSMMLSTYCDSKEKLNNN